MDGCVEAILKAILKVLHIMYHHGLIRLYASEMTRIAQLQQIVFGVHEVVGCMRLGCMRLCSFPALYIVKWR